MTPTTTTTNDTHTPANQSAFEGFLSGMDSWQKSERKRSRSIKRHERRAHKVKAKVSRILGERQIAQAGLARDKKVLDQATEVVDNDPQTTGRGRGFISGWTARLCAALLVGGLYFVDSTLLLVLMLSKSQTRMLTIVVVAASAMTAWMFGTMSRTWADEPHPEIVLGPSHRTKMRAALFLGIGIEVTLAVIRAVGSGTPMSSLLLGMAGCGLWAGVAYMSYAAHDGAAAIAGRAWRKVKRSAHQTNQDAAFADKLVGKLRMTQQELIDAAGKQLATVNGLIDGSIAVWSKSHPVPDRPTFPWLDRLDALAKGDLSPCCVLDDDLGSDPGRRLELVA